MRFLVTLLALLGFVATAHAAELGDDGLYKSPWMRNTFKDLREDLGDANSEGKRLMVMIEQRGCIYCKKMHEEVYPIPEIENYIEDHYFVVQLNMFGDTEVTDFDGTVMSEREAVKKWGMLFTPTILYFPQEVADDLTAAQAAVAVVPGAFGRYTTLNMLRWIVEKGYEGDESFQKYHARMLQKEKG